MSSLHIEVGLLEKCRGCTKEFKPESLLRHVGKAKKCKAAYGSESDYENFRREKHLAAKRSSNARNQLERKEKHARYNRINRIQINLKKRIRDIKRKDAVTKNDRFVSFRQEIKDGPSFVCFSCDRALFLRGVSILEDKDIMKLKDKPGEIFLTTKIFTSDVDYNNSQWTFCHSCLSYIRKCEVPKIHVSNGLQLDDIPDSLKLTELEQQLIAKDIIFMKIKKLPKSRMQAILDRVINVPIQDEDIIKTVTSLPRPRDKAGVVGVRLKRKMDLKNAHIESFVRPHMLIEALKTFKSLGNVHYKDVEIDESFLEKAENETPMETDSDSANSDSDSDSFDNDDILDAVKIGQSKRDSHTCMVPINPEEDIVVNDCNTTLYKKLKENGRSHEIAPGENKRPSNWCREKDFDVKAFSILHPTGKYGLNYDRLVQISCQMYFNQRLLNIDDRFAENMAYLFMAQQFIERRALERQMDISGQRGVVQKDGNSVNVSLKDPFSIFAQIKGTPKYWQKARNELIAKVKVLGPFQVFFTLSCAEMRWSEIFVAVLRRKGYKVEYKEDAKGWNGSDDTIIVNGKKLWEFVDSMAESKHELLKDHVFLITRMFDERVKSFIKNLLMGKGSDSLHIMFYTYRIEMQDRGLPHVHGVAWIDPEWL